MNVNVLARFNSGELYGEWYRPFEIKYTCVQTYEYRLGTVVLALRGARLDRALQCFSPVARKH